MTHRSKLLAVLALVAVFAGLATVTASHYANKYFLFSPGTAPSVTPSATCKPSDGELVLPKGEPCVRLLLPRAKAHEIEGKVLMVDVELSQASPLDWLEAKFGLLGPSRQLVSVRSYAGATPTSELGCQDSQAMLSANQDAALAALSSLGYKVAEKPIGAQVTTVFTGSPAWRAGIRCNDVITAVNGRAVTTDVQFTHYVRQQPLRSVVTLTEGLGADRRRRVVKARLTSTPPKMAAIGFPKSGYLGLALSTLVRPVLPFKVSVNAGDIGGPSAGLAFTLAILDALSNGKLTGGHIVAATGTINPQGQVGDVGGVQEKAVAVEKAGAQLFFVPEVEYAAAESIAGKKLQVVPVTTLAQALQVLHKRFGQEPLPATSNHAAATARGAPGAPAGHKTWSVNGLGW